MFERDRDLGDEQQHVDGYSDRRGDVVDLLRQEHPYGHPRFLPITLREMKLHSEKNHDYAKGGNPLGNFNRVASILSHYPNLSLADPRVVALVYALKQVDAVLWSLNTGHVAKVEGQNQRLQDISVYAKIVMCMNEDLDKEQFAEQQFAEQLKGFKENR